jgi:hypothetical protein
LAEAVPFDRPYEVGFAVEANARGERAPGSEFKLIGFGAESGDRQAAVARGLVHGEVVLPAEVGVGRIVHESMLSSRVVRVGRR